MLEAHAAAGHGAGRRRRAGARRAAADAGAGRRDRGGDPARRHRLPDRLGRQHRARATAAAYVHFGMTSSDLLDTALARAAGRGHRHAAGQGRPAGRRAARPRAGAPGHAPGRAARTASTPSPTSGGTGSPTSPSPLARSRDRLRARPRGGRRREDLRRGRHVLATSTRRSRSPWPRRSGCAPADAATQVVMRDGDQRVGVRAGDHRHRLRGDRAGGPARPAHRGARAVGAVRHGPEGLVRDAAQEEPDPLRADRRAGPGRARGDRAGHGGHPALARAGHLALLDRAGRRCPTPRSPPTTCCT